MNRNNILMIKDMNVVGMKEKVGKFDNTKLNDKNKIYDHLNRQDMMKFLGLDSPNLPCPFHDDHRYSARVYKGDDGRWWFQCSDDNCKVKKLNMIHLTERLIDPENKNTMYVAVKYLIDVYNVELIDADWAKEYGEIIDENISAITKFDDMEEMYPDLYRVIKRYIGILKLMNNLAREYVSNKERTDSNGNPIFVYDIMRIVDDLTVDNKKQAPRRVSQKISLFALLGLLRKLPDSEIPDNLFDDLNRYKREKNYCKRTQVYSIPPYTSKLFSEAEYWATKFIESKMSMKFFSWYTVYKNFGRDEASRVFPQESNREIDDDGFEMEMTKFVMNELESNNFIRINDVIGYMKEWNKNNAIMLAEQTGKTQKITNVKVDLRVSQIIENVLSGYGLKRTRFNKEYKKKFNMLDCKDQSWIIVYDE